MGLFIALLNSCELPEGPPDVEVETIVRAPILAEKTLVVLGPQDGVDALIDTTQKKLDTLFQVGSDYVLSIVAEESLSDLVNTDNLSQRIVDRVTPDPVSLSARATEITNQDLNIAYNVAVGTMEVGAQDLGETTLSIGTLTLDPINTSQNLPMGRFSNTLNTSLSVPATDIVPGVQNGTPLPAVTNQEITITRVIDFAIQPNLYLIALSLSEGSFTLELTNQLGWNLNISRIDLLNPEGELIGTSTEAQALPQDQTATFTVPLIAGRQFHRSLTFRLTVSWSAQVVSNPQYLSIRVQGRVEGDNLTFEVRGGNAAMNIASSSPITISDQFVTATFVANSSPDINRLYVDLTNRLPFTLEDGSGQGAVLRLFSGSRQINEGNDRFGAPIPPGGTARLEIDLSGQTLRNQITYELEAAIPPSATPYTLQATDGIEVQVTSTSLQIKQARADVQPLNLDLGSGLIDISNIVDFADLTEESGGVNELIVALTNNLAFQLTDGTLNPDAPPRIFIRRPDESQPLAELVFERSPQPGETVIGIASLAGKRITSQLQYELDIGTPGGQDIIFDQSNNVVVHVTTTPLRFYRARAAIPPQQRIQVVRENIAVGAESQLAGAILKNASLQFTIYNSLPIPLTINHLTVRNREPVGTFPAGFKVLELTDVTLDPEQPTTLTVQLQNVPIAPHIDTELQAGTPGSNGALVEVAATDTLGIQATGSAIVERLYFYPQGETFSSQGTLSLNAEDVQFGPDDFIALSQGELVLDNVTNTLDLFVDTLQISFSNLRKPPFGQGDSLVVLFIRGASDQPDRYIFAGIPPRTSGLSYQIPLANLRIYPTNNELRYFIRGRLETSNQVRTLQATDSLYATATLQHLDFEEFRATAQQLVTDLTEDQNGDGLLDLATEAQQTSIEGLSDLSRRVQGLEITGTELSLSLRTNLVGEVTLYLALQGIRDDGTARFLQGRGRFAVPASDPIAAKLTYQQAPIAPENLIRLQFSGAPSPDQTVTRTFLFTSDNSNVDAFLSLLPSEIRAVGRTVVDGRVQLKKPLQLEASAGLSIPLHLTSPRILVQDTLDIDFSDIADLPTGPEEDIQIEEAQLILSYENGIPLGGTLQLDVLDAQGQPIGIQVPVDAPLSLKPAPVDAQGFARDFQPGEQTITLTRQDIEHLKQGRKALLRINIQTPSPANEARIRASDAIRIRLQAQFKILLRVNP